MDKGIVSINVSSEKGTPKSGVPTVNVIENVGFHQDAHAGSHDRQVSLLAMEHVESMRRKGVDVKPGSFAENITTQGVDLDTIAIGDRLKLGDGVILEVTRIGKECHEPCAIYHQAGECVMPDHGVFTRVVRGGTLQVGDDVEIVRTAQ